MAARLRLSERRKRREKGGGREIKINTTGKPSQISSTSGNKGHHCCIIDKEKTYQRYHRKVTPQLIRNKTVPKYVDVTSRAYSNHRTGRAHNPDETERDEHDSIQLLHRNLNQTWHSFISHVNARNRSSTDYKVVPGFENGGKMAEM